ncbi:NADAR family protein [Frankia gtarii]|uniref:NADAR family protein n=1 Tax=Frankia gtarii TaxID=2950102 RepID=UPI0021BF4769|nr:NADAR family protein [Frankia gtarii]
MQDFDVWPRSVEWPRSVDDLRRLQETDDLPKFLFFWGHRPAADGGIGKGCLSQWWPIEFTVDGTVYRSAEHFMMEQKARLFGDDTVAKRVLVAASPGEAKALGRHVRDFDEETWSDTRYNIVVRGNIAKFGQHPALRDFLVNTGQRTLVEASPVDRIWGIGVAADDERSGRPNAWPGLNLLGFALMEVRARVAKL